MRKTYGNNMIKIIIIWFFCIHVDVYAQSNDIIIGYENIVWGASIQNVQQSYRNLLERESKEANIGVREFQQNNVENGILSRVFYFFQNKLFRVTINYDTLNDVYSRARILMNNIKNIYGTYDESNSLGGGVDNYFFDEFYVKRNYNNRLRIEIRFGNTLAYDYFVGVFIIGIFSNPETENEIEIEKIRQRQNNRTYIVPMN
jgi:hypothetical protein